MAKKTETEQQPTQNRSQIRFCAKQRDNLAKDENPMDQIKIVVYSVWKLFYLSCIVQAECLPGFLLVILSKCYYNFESYN